MAVKKKSPATPVVEVKTADRPNWAARWASYHDNVLPLLPMPDGMTLPVDASVEDLRAAYCVTRAPDDATSDERCSRMRNISDPIETLAIVAPHIRPIETTPVIVDVAHEDADGIALPVAIGEGSNGGFVDGGWD